MAIDLRVLDHLGIRLYSNAAAVLSEAVANAWDADASDVDVQMELSKGFIVVKDDGNGMDLAAINDRFLNVGYDKRANEGGRSARGRVFMGRKGIGKLSLFSIADEVTVHTSKNGERHAFSMSTEDIQAAIARRQEYLPQPVPFKGPDTGTLIVLTKLKRRRAGHATSALRKRVARRFSVIGLKTQEGDSFDVTIDGKRIGAEDRDDLRASEFIWEFGESRNFSKGACPNVVRSRVISGVVADAHPSWRVTGWIAAAPRPTDLRTDESGTMNGIVIVARGRLIQENVLDKLGFNRLFVNYVTGQVEADFLDADDEMDIATSDRQRLIEDDDRYMALVAFLRRTLLDLAEEWTGWRNEFRGKEAKDANPALRAWINGLPESQRDAATKMLGLIEGVELEEPDERKILYRAGVLAFERLRLRDASHRLAELPVMTAKALLPLLSDLTALEGSMYRDIVRERLEVINKFVGIVDADEKERVLQECLFQNLWLLDPGWERATGSERMEQRLKTEFEEFADGLDDARSLGRIDIRYRTNAGEHIIVELKRAGRVLTVPELNAQGYKYKSALTKCLKAANGPNYTPHVSVVFVLGVPVAEAEEEQYVRDTLRPINARIVYYETLIEGARTSYREFMERSKAADAIDALISGF